MRRGVLALGACAALAPPLRAFELECFHGAGATPPTPPEPASPLAVVRRLSEELEEE